ncbi:MAG: DUF503 domain-containing protein [Acidimicrobiia bacterium]
MHAAALRFDLYLRECRSLKAKRSVLRPVQEGLRRRLHVSVAEVGHQDSWHRASIGVAAVASSAAHLREVLDSVERFVWSFPEVEVVEVVRTTLDVEA